MDDNGSGQAQPTSANQLPQGFSASSSPDISQQQDAIQANSENEPKMGKKIIKALGGLIILLVLVVAGLFVLLTPTVKGLSACMQENSKNMDALFQRGLEEKWNNEQKCAEFRPESEKLIACYKAAGQKSVLPEKLAFTLGGFINSSVKNTDEESIIKLHNTSCSQYPETLLSP